MSEDDAQPLVFVDDPTPMVSAPGWRILVVDDEPEMHAVTRLALSGVRYQNRDLEFLSAHSAREARELLAQNDDIALILLDVVMESDDAGLRLARYVREQLGNDRVRIVLRTGQAGQAPERDVILDYDINDYKEKTELSSQKLITCVISSLRAYQAIDEVATLNRQLEQTVAQRTAELVLSNARLKQSLEALEQGERAGRRVQFKLLPPKQQSFERFHFSHVLRPSDFMSGDFVDYFAIDDDRVLFYIADVSGHGVASAFVTVYLKRFVGAALEAKHGGRQSAVDDPAQLLSLLNQDLLRDRIGKHIAMFVGVLDTRQRQLLYANAGAYPYPLLVEPAGARFLEQRSTPVGLLDSATYTNEQCGLADLCRLLLVSDGVLELLPQPAAAQKLQRLCEAVDLQTEGAEAVLEALGFSADLRPPDDVALLLLGYDGVQ